MDQLLATLFHETKNKAARRGINFSLTIEEFERIAKKADGKCQVTGINFCWKSQGKGKKRPFAPSIDRIDSAGYYEAKNVRLVCVAANIAMNDWGESVLIKMANAICGEKKAIESKEPAFTRNEDEKSTLQEQSESRFISRDEAANYLTKMGLKTAKGTLQKWVTTGGGPVFRRYGKMAVYKTADLDNWAKEKLSTPRSSSSATHS